MKVVAVVVAVIALFAIASATVEPLPLSTERFLFDSWVIQHSKAYVSVEEETKRFDIFRANLQKIREHNASGDSWTMAANKFADLTAEEFKAMYLGVKMQHTPSREVFTYSGAPLKASVDWRSVGQVVTAVKDQGQCGSCWAFSTIAATEGFYALAHNNQQVSGSCSSNGFCGFSEQQLVDCSTAQGNQGCNGGWMDYGFAYLAKNKADLEKQYPYTARDGTCKTSVVAQGIAVGISGFVDVATMNADALKEAVTKQPVSVAIEADQSCFQFYSSGILSDKCACGTQLDHGVTLVGYDDQSWIVKNSWGASWGDKGYIRISNTVQNGNLCGILQASSFPK